MTVAQSSLQKIIASYLYVQYNDDDDLQAFVDQYNEMSQEYLDTCNNLQLPIYTRSPVDGALLDWVALGLYGFLRPSLPNPAARFVGPFNTYTMASVPFNVYRQSNPNVPAYLTDDDLFRRVITWHFYKGDGLHFNIDWLKRRVMRFLFGANGVDIAGGQTYQVSVTFGAGNEVNINLIRSVRQIVGGAIFGRFRPGSGTPFNSLITTRVTFPPIVYGDVFKTAVDGGILELPFQFKFNVTSGSVILL